MKIKAVIIGSYGHYEYALEGKIPVGFCGISAGVSGEPTEELHKRLTALGHLPRVYENPIEMLDSEKPDVVIINSRMDKNAFYSEEALKRGVSVFCEKPVATTLRDLDRLEKTFYDAKREKANIVLAGMFGITSSPCFETARREIASGKIGEVRLALAQKSYKLGTREPFYSSREQLGGMIPWVAIHGIDWLTSVCGLEFSEVFARHSRKHNSGNGDLEMTAVCQYSCKGGAIASVSADYFRPSAASSHGDDRLRVVGTNGIIEVSHGKTYMIDSEGERELPLFEVSPGLFDSFLSELSGKGTCISGAENAFYVTRAALLARESADKNKIVKF